VNHQAIVETVFKSVISTLPTELGALLGQELKCSDMHCRLATKDELFAEPRSKSSLAHLKISGDHEGLGFLILPVKSAIVFGGTLIMLPKDQINENVRNETLDGEVRDAYGEVANILAGVLTQVFLEKYSKSLRFVRTEVEELIGTKVDVASDKPFPPGSYFHLSSEISMDTKPLGKLEVIVPLAVLDLEVPPEQPAVAPATAPVAATAEAQPAPPTGAAAAADSEPALASAPEKTPTRVPFADAKKVAEVVVKATLEQAAEEVGALLGQTFSCSDLKFELITKDEFFSHQCQDTSILTYMTVSGSAEGRVYLFNLTKDAILMGGTLIMLPNEELHLQVNKGKFEGEVADAYGEVANIIAGGLTQTFLERYPHPLRFVKTTSTSVIPTKVDMAGEEPLPPGDYYLASCATSLQGDALGRMLLLFPAAVLGLENGHQAEPTPVKNQQGASAVGSGSAPDPKAGQAQPQATKPPAEQRQMPAPPADATPVVLVITDSPHDAEPVCSNLADSSYETKVIGYKDDLRGIFSAHPVLGIFLLMSEVGEKGFSVAIKLQSCGYPLPPVIAGGPAWTRSSVLKAVKYGVRDILVTPASDEDIREKFSQHLSRPA